MEVGDRVNVIICLDDNNGMMFNKRRQSSDAVLTQRILDMSNSSKLWVNEYSAKLFEGFAISVAPDFLERAGDGEYCFVEDADIAPYMDRIEKLILYRWNRRYPSDQKFALSLDDWTLMQSQEFTGKSHSVIMEEVYMR